MATESPATAQHFIYVTQIYFCTMYGIVVWDWLVSLPREYRFIWKSHWTPVKIAYLFCRYWVIIIVPYLLWCFVVDHPLETCQKIFRIPVALAMWNQVGSECVLLIRTYAFFNRNVYVLIVLSTALAGVVAYQLFVDAKKMMLLPFINPDYGPCFPISVPHSAHLLGFFIAPLLFDAIVTAMTVIKAIGIRRRHGGPNSRLIQTFIREGVFYFITISIANLINGVFYLQPRQVMSAINIPLSVMMAPLLACRLILDLRQRGMETVSQSDGTGPGAFTTNKINSNSQSSPFTPPNLTKSAARYASRNPHTMDSNIVLSTLGSIPHDDAASFDVAIDHIDNGRGNIHFPAGVELESLSTAIGGENGEPIGDEESLAPSHRSNLKIPQTPSAVHRGIELGFRPTRAPSISDGVRGIRVEVEKATATL